MMPSMVHVEWIDSGMHMDHGWASQNEYMARASMDRLTVHTVGLLMQNGSDLVLIGLNYDPAHDAWIGVQAIQRSNIISMEMLRNA